MPTSRKSGEKWGTHAKGFFSIAAREIPRSAGESAELRDDAKLIRLRVAVFAEPSHGAAEGVVDGDDLPSEFTFGFSG
jgi:hypothetical protein